jgi:hypothetical protein
MAKKNEKHEFLQMFVAPINVPINSLTKFLVLFSEDLVVMNKMFDDSFQIFLFYPHICETSIQLGVGSRFDG